MPAFFADASHRSELAVDLGGSLVGAFLDVFLHLADGHLRLAFELLYAALDLQLFRADRLADALLDAAGGLVGVAFNLVGTAADRGPPS